MEHISLTTLFLCLFILLLGSAFFSGSETSLMALNRYKLKTNAKTNRWARMTEYLLQRPERLLSVILIGNNFTNITASAIATIIGSRLMGNAGIIIATGILTLVILIFAEIAPKTLGILAPEKMAYPAAVPLRILLIILHPLVYITSNISRLLLKSLGFTKKYDKQHALTSEELRVAITETSGIISNKYKSMLLNVLDLSAVTVNDIMVPRTEITGIDIAAPLDNIMQQLKKINHTLVPVFTGNIEQLQGIVHAKDLLHLLATNKCTIEELTTITQAPYFVPEGTSLYTQLINFQQQQQRIAMVVDEYGDVLGLITIDDLLEEIVGELASNTNKNTDIVKQADNSYIIIGSMNIRDLNRTMHWQLPTDGAKTLSGLIIDALETIPNPGTCVLINNYPLEAMLIQDNKIASVRVRAKLTI